MHQLEETECPFPFLGVPIDAEAILVFSEGLCNSLT